MTFSKWPIIVASLCIGLSGCLTDPMKESPEQLAADIAAGTQRAKLAGNGYVECTLAYAESHRKSEVDIEHIADAASLSCRKYAVDAGIYQNQIDVFHLIQIRAQHTNSEVSSKAEAIPTAEQRTQILVTSQRAVIIEYLRRSQKLG